MRRFPINFPAFHFRERIRRPEPRSRVKSRECHKDSSRKRHSILSSRRAPSLYTARPTDPFGWGDAGAEDGRREGDINRGSPFSLFIFHFNSLLRKSGEKNEDASPAPTAASRLSLRLKRTLFFGFAISICNSSRVAPVPLLNTASRLNAKETRSSCHRDLLNPRSNSGPVLRSRRSAGVGVPSVPCAIHRSIRSRGSIAQALRHDFAANHLPSLFQKNRTSRGNPRGSA